VEETGAKEEETGGKIKIRAVEEVAPIGRRREERREERYEERRGGREVPFDRMTVLNELERTKDLMQRWIFSQESLINYLRDIQQREDGRLRQMIDFREEVGDALWDARQRRQ
jgi:hypothetical protein